jgi:hypothetical protein
MHASEIRMHVCERCGTPKREAHFECRYGERLKICRSCLSGNKNDPDYLGEDGKRCDICGVRRPLANFRLTNNPAKDNRLYREGTCAKCKSNATSVKVKNDGVDWGFITQPWRTM